MKTTVSNLASPNALRVHVRHSVNPTHLLVAPMEIPINTQARFSRAHFRSLKHLREDARYYGLHVVKFSTLQP